MFSHTLNLSVLNQGIYDIQNFGYGNYVCNNVHLLWGNSVSCLFMEALGINVQPLLLGPPYYNHDFYHGSQHKNYFTFTEFLNTFKYIDTNDISTPTKDLDERIRKFFQWLSACSQFFDANGKNYTPPYSVNDWINAEQKMYNCVLNLQNSNNRKSDASDIIEEVLSEIIQKTNVKNICNNEISKIGIYPCDSIFALLKIYAPYKKILPKIYGIPELNYLTNT
jgi:CRISPR/Cas system CSM-associated protein Csm2 small subunit